MIGYYSQIKPNQYNGRLTPNGSELLYWKKPKTVANFIGQFKKSIMNLSKYFLI